jgi:hypothetical protein
MIPCHRVIGADGSLTGYGGGLWRKQRLIEIERLLRSADRETGGAAGHCLPDTMPGVDGRQIPPSASRT